MLLYIFTVKYWHVLDSNHDGALDFDELHFTMAGFAATSSGVIFAVFDENEDGIMVEDEFRKFGEWLETMLEITDNDSDVYLDTVREVWLNAQG